MKKGICLLLCALLLCSFAGCGKNETVETPDVTISTVISKSEVQESAARGEIIGVQFQTGTQAGTIYDYFDAVIEQQRETTDYIAEEDELHYTVNEGQTLTMIQSRDVKSLYPNADEDRKIAVIAAFGDAYHFTVGNAYEDNITAALGEPDQRDIPAQSDLFYLYQTPDTNYSRLTYLFGDMRLDFILQSDALCAVVLTDTRLYDGLGNSETSTAAVSDSTDA